MVWRQCSYAQQLTWLHKNQEVQVLALDPQPSSVNSSKLSYISASLFPDQKKGHRRPK